ncbi:MAG: hypothetical protein C0482_05050 [Gordonia sp.]|nr:hypothetical protein [Gordonia sp. (in: high G+C Gram-positive bacteria)]
MLLIVDEFGKNLEAYSRSRSTGDPYLLQELAESTQGENPLPLIIITMQHLAFDEYVQDSSAARRREWAKVQGRFQDIPYVETPEQSRKLIIESLHRRQRTFNTVANKWIRKHKHAMENLNLKDLLAESADALPLHPATLAVLPELCSRYGQNERTLFAFMAGPEPLAVPTFLRETEWEIGNALPVVGLDRVYDFFLDSVASMVGVSENASRWLEVETRIRDTAGLKDPELRALKTIGVLNLTSTGGRLRASKAMLEFALQTGDTGSTTPAEIATLLETLEARGLLIYRTFSDEYRIWQGSDYDLKRAIDSARRRCENASLQDLLNGSADLQPVVAGRHSQRTGVLRIFGQLFSDLSAGFPVDPQWDGVVLFATEPVDHDTDDLVQQDGRPVVVVSPTDISTLREAALEAAALRLALRAAEEEDVDWVARRELSERTAAGQQQLRRAIAQSWSYASSWQIAGSGVELRPEAGVSSILSAVSDLVYTATPRLANEMIARRELTSQGAKARRMLIDSMVENEQTETLGLEGYGPERAIYEAVLRSTGMHRETEVGTWSLTRPTDKKWREVWDVLNGVFDEADETRIPLNEVMGRLTLPPYGLKDGVLPLLTIAALQARRDDVALYEHGSLVLALDDAVSERLAKNPRNFAVRNSGARGRARREVIQAVADRMGIVGRGQEAPTFLNVTTALFRELRLLPPFTQKTKTSLSEQTMLVREAFHTAAEPDVLIFETLPGVFDIGAFRARGRSNPTQAARYANLLADSILELRNAYSELLKGLTAKIAGATSLPSDLPEMRSRLQARGTELDGRVLEPRLRAFVGALTRAHDDQGWLENVAMVVSEGQAPRVWTDDIAARFPLRIAELGGAMRRTEALLYERLAQNHEPGTFVANRITVTRPDGTEWNELVAISDTEQKVLDDEFGPLIERMTLTWGSRSAACRMLMARLAAEEFGVASTEAHTIDEGDVKHG